MDIFSKAGLEVAGLLVALGGAYYVAKWRLDRWDTDFEKFKSEEFSAFKADVWREVGKLRDWRHSHEKETSDKRLEIAEQISDIRIAGAKTDERFAAIMGDMKDIKRMLSKLQGDDA